MALVLALTLAGIVAFVALCALAYGLGALLGDRGESLRERVRARLGYARPPEPDGRPIEAIVADLRRLGRRFHTLDPRTAYAKVEAVRYAYDRTLAECCTALGITHLLEVLPAGAELDAERERVEEQLAGCGVRFPHAA
jgi:hypothetical protein